MIVFWDASGLAKRYFIEEGSPTVNAIFALVPRRDMATTPWGYVESYSILLRRYNGGVIDLTTFTDAVGLLQSEIVDDPEFTILPITDEMIFASLAVMHRHNLNSTDAAILAMLLRTLPSPPPDDFVLVAADRRLLRAAGEEGMKTLDPAAVSAADVPALFAALDPDLGKNKP